MIRGRDLRYKSMHRDKYQCNCLDRDVCVWGGGGGGGEKRLQFRM